MPVVGSSCGLNAPPKSFRACVSNFSEATRVGRTGRSGSFWKAEEPVQAYKTCKWLNIYLSRQKPRLIFHVMHMKWKEQHQPQPPPRPQQTSNLWGPGNWWLEVHQSCALSPACNHYHWKTASASLALSMCRLGRAAFITSEVGIRDEASQPPTHAHTHTHIHTHHHT